MSRLFVSRAVPISRRLSAITRPSSFKAGPAPPRLPPEEQEELEQLQRGVSINAYLPATAGVDDLPAVSGLQNQVSRSTQERQSSDSAISRHARVDAQSTTDAYIDADTKATGRGEEFHPDARRGVGPEFHGDVNPVTGEVGGPKNNPLKWGSTGDWSYNGRVTDF